MKPKVKSLDKLPTFEEDVEAIENFIRKHWNGISHAKPKGWNELRDGYRDFAGMREWDEKECEAQEAEFEGFNNSTATTFNFVKSVSLPTVMYGSICQGRSPLTELIGACIAYGQARGIVIAKSQNNDQEFG